MLKKVGIVSGCFFFGFSMASATNIKLLETQQIQNNTQNNTYEEEYINQDVWYGPGFYYGIWFDNEQNYWGWRNEHWDYPPNHHYYNHDHPVEYHHEDHQGEHDRSRHDGEEHRGGGRGGHGGGGRK